jgi:hypothetical protein
MGFDKLVGAFFVLIGFCGVPILVWFGESYSLPEWIFQTVPMTILLICAFIFSVFLRNLLDGLARKIWFLIIPAYLLFVVYVSFVFLTYWFTTSTTTSAKPLYLTNCYSRTLRSYRYYFLSHLVTEITFEDSQGNRDVVTFNSELPCPSITSTTNKADRQIVLHIRKGIFGTIIDDFVLVKPANKTH